MTVLATEHRSISATSAGPPLCGDRSSVTKFRDKVGADCMSEPLRQFGPEIWIADGPVVSFYGFRLSNADGGDPAV